ncbi:hypothetical protein ACFQV2_33805 [Actinokineospora soli]|uniref:DUF4404 family protein n=1 Tax=Actinokineospora soli TaxID=1048753 RepID=A0ABW2TWC8_9PSEU
MDGISVGGNVEGQNVVIGGTQEVHGDLTITVGALPAAGEGVRATLQDQVARLVAELDGLPDEHADEVAEAKVAVRDAIDEAEREEPDPDRLRQRGNLLKRSVEGLAALAPSLSTIAVEIASTLGEIG